MFTLDAHHDLPSLDSEQTAPLTEEQPPAPDDLHLRRRLAQDLNDADLAITDGRIEDAHNALIHAQDMVFDFHLAVTARKGRGGPLGSSDIYLHLTNRLIDANRSKDRSIIAECRSLLEILADVYAAVRQTSMAALA